MGSHGLTETLRETLSAFEGEGEPKTTSEVGESLDLGRRSTYDRLDRLVDRGLLETKKVGASARVWWRTTDEAASGPDGSGGTLSRLIDNVPGVVYRCQNAPGWPMSFVSDAATDLTGYDAEAIERGEVSWGEDVVHPEDRERLRREIDAQLTVSDAFTVEYRIVTAEGEVRWVRERGCAVDDERDEETLEGVVTDVTETERSKRALAEREHQFRTLVEATEEYAIFRLDPEGRVQTWNKGAERLKGYESEEILGEHFSTLYPEDAREAGVPEANLRAAAEHGSAEDEGWRVRADGSQFWASVTITAIRDDDGDLTGYAKVTRDMTERREFERELQRERDLLERVFDAIPESVAVLDETGEPVRMNEQMRRYLDIDDSDEADLLPDGTVFDEDGDPVPRGERPSDRALRTGEPVRDWVGRVDLPGEGERWFSVNAVPLTGDEGAVERVVVSAENITQLKEQARRLQRSRDDLEHELNEVLDRVDDGFFALDEEWRFTYVNERAARLLDRRQSDLVGRNVWEAFPAAVDSRFQSEYERARETNDSVSFEAYFPPLETWFEMSAYPSESGLSVYFRDVTERKARERELERYEAIVETVNDGIYVVDEDGYFTEVNETYATMVGRSQADLVGTHVSEVVENEAVLDEAQSLEGTLATDDRATASLEATFTRPDGETWVGEATFSLMETEEGHERVGVVRDVTERKARERELEQYEAVAETASDAVVTIDTTSTIRDVNPAVADVFGYEPAELVGESLTVLMPDRLTERHVDAVDRYLSTGERTLDWEYVELPGVRADGTEIALAVSFSEYEHDGDRYFTGIIRDITERKEYERELERYETIVETVDDGIYALDDESRFVLVNEAFCEMVGYEREELLGAPASMLYDEEYIPVIEERAVAVADGEQRAATIEFELIRKDGTRVPVETRYEPLSDDSGNSRCGVIRDVSERIERERELQRRVRQQEVVTDLGQRALEDRDLDALMSEAAERVARTLDNDYCKVLELDADAERLRLREGVGWDEGVVGEATVSAVEDDSQAAYTLRSAEPVVVEDLTTETRFSGPALLTDHDVRSGISVVIGPPDDPWGILGTHDTDVKAFSEQDVNFVHSVATILATAIDRHRYEEALVSQREQLAALNSLNEVVRETTDAVLDQSTREEIERTVCEHLARTDSYEFAWIGEVDTDSQTVVPRTKAGVEGYLDEVAITVDPDDERGEGPTGRALRTGTIQTTQQIPTDPRYEPWRDKAEAYGFESSAAIPIVYEGTTYGVLNVYAGRPNAFEGRERAVLGQLGEIVGHAIAATERKQALLSDEVVELEFGVPDLFESLALPEQPAGRFQFDHVVTLGDGEFLVYGHATAEAVPSVEALADELPHWADVSFTAEEGDTRFELRMDEPPVFSTLASFGGSVESAVVEDGDYRMTLQLSPSSDVRQVIETVQDAYPSATMLRRQQVTKEDGRSRPTTALLDELTERQRTTLEAAYHAGFFEWPRDASGEDVASSLQVSPPTFHQHLRKAEEKVFGALFGSAGG